MRSKPIEVFEHEDFTDEELFQITLKGENREDYIGLSICAMNLDLQEGMLGIKDEEGSSIVHKCMIAFMNLPLPIKASILQQNRIIVPSLTGGGQNKPLQIALLSIPKIRMVMKRDCVVDTLTGENDSE